ncbi:hypothetical protein EDD15DRAFT_2373477 [Pisolithus albus]|nr:hypothetical protein EDD15DRAFT_2373477 [Pisolithus albus]
MNNGYQARMYLRKTSRKESKGATATQPSGGQRADDIASREQNRPRSFISGISPADDEQTLRENACPDHIGVRVVQGRRDTCSAAQSSSPQGSSHAECDKIRSKTLDQPPRRSSTSHPPVMAGHCARMFAAGRRDSCSGVRYPFVEGPETTSPAQELTQDLKKKTKSIWGSHDVVNGKPRKNKE